MSAADGKLEPRELAAYGEAYQRLRGESPLASTIDALVTRFGATKPAEIPTRVRALGPKVPPALREQAFKLAMGLALVDEEGSAEEDDLVGVLVEALGLEMSRAEALAAEVRRAFGIE